MAFEYSHVPRSANLLTMVAKRFCLRTPGQRPLNLPLTFAQITIATCFDNWSIAYSTAVPPAQVQELSISRCPILSGKNKLQLVYPVLIARELVTPPLCSHYDLRRFALVLSSCNLLRVSTRWAVR